MTSCPDIQPLAWDSAWLGFPVARLVAGPLYTATALQAAIAQARAAGIRLLYLVAAPDNEPVATAALANGAWLADCKVTYQLPLLHSPPPAASSSSSPVLTTTLTPGLRQLALQSGAFSRFRLDARIGQQAFEELYTTWLSQTLVHGLVWSASLANESQEAGMLAFTAHEATASIELLAVAPRARRHGIGRQLVHVAQRAALQRGCTVLQVVTQAANAPACLFYERCGFGQVQADPIYHLWL